MKKSKKVALGGMIAALSLVLMFLTGVFPFATLALPGLAGTLLIFMVIEIGRGYAFVVYFAVALLSIFLAPDREAALIYLSFLGYYPILKSKLEQLHSRVIEYLLKILIFSSAAGICYFAAVYLFGLEDLAVAVSWIAGGYLVLLVTFLVYDRALGMLVSLYLRKIRPEYLQRLLK